MMLIEQVFPQVVQKLSDMKSCLIAEFKSTNTAPKNIDSFISRFPNDLLTAKCFLCKLTGLWRYEFGLPSTLDKTKKLLWGTPMWPAVNTLLKVVLNAHLKLPQAKLKIYLQRLTDLKKHQDALVEMIPTFRINHPIPTDFEVTGYGPGNETIDWKIGPIENRQILLDVKNRNKDLYEMMDRENTEAPPQHEHSLLFRGLEGKFLPTNPDQNLQGAFIFTSIKQESKKLLTAFNQLDSSKIHFAIIGDEKEDAHVLARRTEDEIFLRKIFNFKSSERFTFEEENNSAPKSNIQNS
jgi:hypothetical protein